MPAINEKERSVLFYKRMILVVILLTITVLAVIAVVQGVQIHKIKLGNESRAAQNAEQAETIERQTKQLEEQMQELEELRRQKNELETLTQQQSERLAALEAQVAAAAAATTSTTSAGGYQALYPDFYAPQTYSANSAPNKTAYLTFDDGPSGNTDIILQTLQEENVKATFFVVGTDNADNLARMRRIVQEGHTIGMHSYSHSYKKIYASVEAFLKDMYQVFNLIKDTTGVTPTCFRFPGGSINSYNKAVYKDIKAEMIRRGFVPYDWNVSSGDASTTKYTPEQLTGYVLNGIGSKSRIIVLMHDSSSKENTAQAVRQIIIGIREKGFIFAPLDYQTKPILF